jgi:hypothetical protein
VTRSFPWDDPGATGYGRRVDADSYKRIIEQSRAHIAKRDSLLGSLSDYHTVLMEFMSRHDLRPQLDRLDGASEMWLTQLGYERLERYVWFTVRRATQFDGLELHIENAAYWIGGPNDSYSTLPPRRRFIVTTLCTAETFAETLELALLDAKSLTVDDLNRIPLPSHAPGAPASSGPRLDAE